MTELELHPGFKCSLKKNGGERKNEHKYIFLCLHHLYTEGRTAERWLESEATFQTPKMTSAISKAPGPRVSPLTPDRGPFLVFQEI